MIVGLFCKVLIVDDLVVVWQMFSEILVSDFGIEVVGIVVDLLLVCEKIKCLYLDVIMLDVEMLCMDGLVFLENFMCLYLVLVVMIFLLIECGVDIILQVLVLGVVDFVFKLKLDVVCGLQGYVDEIIVKVKMVVCLWVCSFVCIIVLCIILEIMVIFVLCLIQFCIIDWLIVIGVFVGGIEVLCVVFEGLFVDVLAVVMMQYLFVIFSSVFVECLDWYLVMLVCEVSDGEVVFFGYVYLFLGGRYLCVICDGVCWCCWIDDGLFINCYKLVVDVLFCLVVESVGVNVIGVIFIGMGDDGVCGLLELCNVGVLILVQDEVISVVWGMFGVVYKFGVVEEMVLLECIVEWLMVLVCG